MLINTYLASDAVICRANHCKAFKRFHDITEMTRKETTESKIPYLCRLFDIAVKSMLLCYMK